MNAVVMERYGTPDVLELRDVATPTPRATMVALKQNKGLAYMNELFEAGNWYR
jgi:hypothetical protein